MAARSEQKLLNFVIVRSGSIRIVAGSSGTRAYVFMVINHRGISFLAGVFLGERAECRCRAASARRLLGNKCT